jgi:hypothetical protein
MRCGRLERVEMKREQRECRNGEKGDRVDRRGDSTKNYSKHRNEQRRQSKVKKTISRYR